MSEPIPESIPTSTDRRSSRPTKKRALTPTSAQSNNIDALFAHPDREILIPSSGPKARAVAAPPEIVANVQGSSAGAGSGEFHVYKASRRREYERLAAMDEEMEREGMEREFVERKEGWRREEESKLSKNQAKRAKARARKERGRGGAGMEVDGKEDVGGNGSGGVKKKLGASRVVVERKEEEAGEGAVENGDVSGAVEEGGGGITFHDDD